MIDVAKLLVIHKLKLTEARKLLLEKIAKEKKPVDAGSLIEYLQKELGIDRVTVFRILNALTKHGILRKLEFQEGKARYELEGEDHHHLICENCGKIEDIEDTLIPDVEKHIKEKHDFFVQRHSLEFYGLCKDCYRKQLQTTHKD